MNRRLPSTRRALVLAGALTLPAVTLASLARPSVSSPAQAQTGPATPALVDSARVTILSSNLADGSTIGEWGFSALVESDGHCVLFDTGRYPDTVLRNADALRVDLSCVTDIVLSHFHFDHTAGVLPIVEALRARDDLEVERVHVATGFFYPRRLANATPEQNQRMTSRLSGPQSALAHSDLTFVEHEAATEILPGIWVTGPVPRTHAEKTYPPGLEFQHEGQWVADNVPESQGLVIRTEEGPIVLLGCGHSGSINLLEHVRSEVQDQPIHALMGGMHLFAADEATLGWTADRLRDIGLEHLMAGHCTGIEPLMRLRTGLGLSRSTAVVGAVGSRFVLGEGIHPTAIAQ